MSAGAKMNCEVCGKDISMAGAQVCPVCDQDIMGMIERRETLKTPNLCEDHFQDHLAAHEAEKATVNCPNCNESGYDSSNPCFRCGHSPAIR